MIKRIITLVLIGLFFFLTNMNAMAKKGDIRVFDFQYERFEFLKGAVALELPDKPRQQMGAYYYKVLMDQAMSWSAGHFEISFASITKYNGPREASLENKLLVERESRHESGSFYTLARTAVWYGELAVIIRLRTNWDDGIFTTASDRDARIAKDDEIFNYIVESFRYRKVDGTYAKPEIVRQPEEVKVVEHTGTEYHGSGQ